MVWFLCQCVSTGNAGLYHVYESCIYKLHKVIPIDSKMSLIISLFEAGKPTINTASYVGVGRFICNGIWTEDSRDFSPEDFSKRGFSPERISGRIFGSEDSFRGFLKDFSSGDSPRGFRKDFGDSLSIKTTKLFKKCIHYF